MIVFDASSVIAAALNPDRTPRQALARVRRDDRLAMSLAVADEIRSVLRRPKFARVLTQERIAEAEVWLFTEVDWFVPVVRISDCRDPDDNKYLELALTARARLLISSDKDLLALHPWRGISVVRPAD